MSEEELDSKINEVQEEKAAIEPEEAEAPPVTTTPLLDILQA